MPSILPSFSQFLPSMDNWTVWRTIEEKRGRERRQDEKLGEKIGQERRAHEEKKGQESNDKRGEEKGCEYWYEPNSRAKLSQ